METLLLFEAEFIPSGYEGYDACCLCFEFDLERWLKPVSKGCPCFFAAVLLDGGFDIESLVISSLEMRLLEKILCCKT